VSRATLENVAATGPSARWIVLHIRTVLSRLNAGTLGAV
jgi:hypothetical protein